MQRAAMVWVWCAVAMATAGGAWALPVQWSTNGHWYDLVNVPQTWVQARDDALGRYYLARAGHLATVTSVEENDFITAQLGGLMSTEMWLGGSQPDWGSEPAGDWSWTTGETWSYTNWRTGGSSDEPNNGTGLWDEDALTMNWGPNVGTWNDSRNYVSFGYVIEYEGDAIPEPGTGALMAVGLVALAARRRRR